MRITMSSASPVPTKSATAQAKAPQSKRITDDDLYRNSSQYRVWSFTKEQLQQRRNALNKRAAAVVREKVRQFIEDHQELSQEELNAIVERAIPVTTEEELKFINFFAKKVQSFCYSLNLPTEVTATAISFFRRFFLINSAMEIHPKHILLTSIFLACKSENYFIGIEAFAKKTKSKSESILKYEFNLLESLQFTLLNHHPFRPLHGFFLDIQFVLRGKVDLNYLGQIYTNCKKKIMEILLTDAVYLYTPPQITLASLLIEDEALTLKYLEVKFGSPSNEIDLTTDDEEPKSETKTEGEPETEKDASAKETKTPIIQLDKLLALIRECQDVITKKDIFTKEEATMTDAKLHYGQNPMMIVERLKRQKQQRDSSLETSEPEEKKQKV